MNVCKEHFCFAIDGIRPPIRQLLWPSTSMICQRAAVKLSCEIARLATRRPSPKSHRHTPASWPHLVAIENRSRHQAGRNLKTTVSQLSKFRDSGTSRRAGPVYVISSGEAALEGTFGGHLLMRVSHIAWCAPDNERMTCQALDRFPCRTSWRPLRRRHSWARGDQVPSLSGGFEFASKLRCAFFETPHSAAISSKHSRARVPFL